LIGNDVSSLKEHVGAFADCHGSVDGDVADVREDRDEVEVQRSEEKIRKCLICKTPFPSAWAGERVCRRCKSTSAWRSGALG
jgi:hypothetical protein